MSTKQYHYALGSAALASALLLASLAGCKPAETPASLIAEARKFQEKGDNVSALIQLKNAVAKEPTNGEARLALAETYNRVGDAVSAEKEVRKAMELGLPVERTLPELLLAQLFQTHYQKVIDATDAIAYTASARVTSQRGVAFYQLTKHAEAAEAFERALKLEPGQPVALMGLANIASARKDQAMAREYVGRVLKDNPKNPEVWAFKGDFERSSGNNAAALEAYQQVLKLDPGSAVGHLQTAYVLIAERRYPEAQAALAEARKIAPKNLNVAYVSALVAFTEKKYPQALEALQQVLKVAPDHWPAVLLAGATQFTLKSMPQAEQHLKRYVETFPDSEYARKLLATTRIATGDAKGALSTLQPLLADAKDPQVYAIAGRAYTALGEFSKATASFEKASTIDPKAPQLRTSLGLAKLQEGDQVRAMTELELATSLDLESTESGMTLAQTAIGLKQYDKALEALANLEKQRPDDPVLRQMSGLARLGKGQRDLARASFERALALKPDFFPATDVLGRMDLEDKKVDQARQRYDAFVKAYPTSVPGLTALAMLSVAQRKAAEATPLLERAAAVDPAAVGPSLFLAAHYRSLGEQAKALSLIRKLQVANPQNPELLELLGQLQSASGDNGGAMETYTRLAVVAPQSALAHFRLGTAHDAMNNLPSAATSYKRALALQPGDLDVQIALARLYLRQKLPGEALSIARQLQKQQPQQAVGWLAEGDVLLSQGKVALALPSYAKAYATGPSAETLIKLTDALRLSGQDKEADEKTAAWRKAHPEDLKVPRYVAQQLLANKKYQLAITEIEAILKREPAHAPSLNNLALAYDAVQDARALPTAEKALAAAPESPDVLDTVGTMLADKGDVARGVALLQKAIRIVPGRADIRYHLIRALVKAKDKDGARREFDLLAAKHADFPLLEEARALLK